MKTNIRAFRARLHSGTKIVLRETVTQEHILLSVRSMGDEDLVDLDLTRQEGRMLAAQLFELEDWITRRRAT